MNLIAPDLANFSVFTCDYMLYNSGFICFFTFHTFYQGCARIQNFHVRVRLACIRIRPYPPLFLDLLSVSADIRPRISAISNKKFYEKLKIHDNKPLKQSSVY